MVAHYKRDPRVADLDRTRPPRAANIALEIERGLFAEHATGRLDRLNRHFGVVFHL